MADSLPAHHLARLDSGLLLVKCFDVSWVNEQPQASAILEVAADSFPVPVVPVIFVTNEVMLKMDAAATESLIDDMLRLLDEIFTDLSLKQDLRSSKDPGKSKVLRSPGPAYAELQIDCDWTAGSQASYFHFLRRLKARLADGTLLTATVRLHQFRDRARQGIPPVDRGVLMAYNVGDLNDWSTENSQLDTNITAAYLLGQPPYPLPLDVALPHYSWGVVYREDHLAYLVNELTAEGLAGTNRFEQLSLNRYRVRQSTYLDGYYLYADDLIRLEGPEAASLIALSRQLQRAVPIFPGQRWLFYRIGSSATRKTPYSWFETLPEAG